ncbi:hypothetical protein [uncultured Roseobacter sp.]|uniref:hypothetical protein n=1 Tax=uncultured Roseobacter sp. TaxID=114847 RepID=UPI0026217483|nr:hypothetical protein [uncultured Roseobacter sp.]
MDDQRAKTVAIFCRPFKLPGFDETLPAGEYDVETDVATPPDNKDPEAWKASVVAQLRPRDSHSGLTRSLSVSLVDLDRARAKDKLSGKDLSQVFLEQMLADPMVQLVMQADGVSEAQLRYLYSGSRTTQEDIDLLDPKTDDHAPRAVPREIVDVHKAENEGMPCRPRT